MTNDRIRVSVIIPAYNEERYLNECLTALLNSRFNHGTFEVLVVDNGSTDRTVEIAGALLVTVLSIDKVKVGAVRNHGARHAKGDYLVFLDADCVIEPEWLTTGIIQLVENKRLVLGGQYLMRQKPSWMEKYWVLSNSQTPSASTSLVGGCIFMSKETFARTRGFAEHLNSGEDSELTERLRKAGYDVRIDPRLSVVHLGYPSEVLPFVRRQMWHSSDYAINLGASLHDKVFLLTLAFMAGCLAFVVSLIATGKPSSIFMVPVLLPPFLLSYKRVSRARASMRKPFDLLSVFCVDVLYLVGRSWGVMVSLRNAVLSPSKKVERR